MKGKCDNKEGGLSWTHPFPTIGWGYKRGCDITEVRVYSNPGVLIRFHIPPRLFMRVGDGFDSHHNVPGSKTFSPRKPPIKHPAPSMCHGCCIFKYTANKQGERTVSYKWTGWVWEITGYSSKTSGKLPNILVESMDIPQSLKRKQRDHNM